MKKGKQSDPSSSTKNPKGAPSTTGGPRSKANESASKSVEIKQPKAQEVPADDAEDRTEELSGRKSYRKREVVSNWDRYESYDPNIASDDEDQQQIGVTKKVSTNFNLDFNELLRDSCEFNSIKFWPMNDY